MTSSQRSRRRPDAPSVPPSARGERSSSGSARVVTSSGKGGDKGPELTEIGAHHTAAWLHSFVENPAYFHPESKMAGFGPPALTHQEIDEVARYLSTLRGMPGHEVKPEMHDTFPEPPKLDGAPKTPEKVR